MDTGLDQEGGRSGGGNDLAFVGKTKSGCFGIPLKANAWVDRLRRLAGGRRNRPESEKKPLNARRNLRNERKSNGGSRLRRHYKRTPVRIDVVFLSSAPFRPRVYPGVGILMVAFDANVHCVRFLRQV